jgi:hypothetical protein
MKLARTAVHIRTLEEFRNLLFIGLGRGPAL